MTEINEDMNMADRYLNSLVEDLPKDLIVHGYLNLNGHPIQQLPEKLVVDRWLNIQNCQNLKTIPPTITVGEDIYCDKSHIDTISEEDLPLYVNFSFSKGIHEYYTEKLKNLLSKEV